MVHYLSELGMVHLDTTLFYLSLWAAATIYTVRCCLDKSPPWTDALECVPNVFCVHSLPPDSSEQRDQTRGIVWKLLSSHLEEKLVAAEIFFVKLNHRVIRQSRIRRRTLAKTTNTSVDDDDDETQE
ncbi:Cyclin-like superfamily [Arabidopsis thaliana x Arabidopsis arenosa]|uniref:Cyclin-like superfamily n=1 Tax=Arabidopsis thaliana x Arabidopsis arenosa TaxID=1240361 RepID=A0A8T1XJS0_9BRAS|nr:Cyclin-like superfamily [Arabidopsis thaliana x Arabidopsis arenosa]